jgi:exodeoxyribonuclease VII small subunit
MQVYLHVKYAFRLRCALLNAIKELIMPKSSSKKIEKSVEELTYEEALAELAEIVSALEGEQNQLEESIKLFERGQALAARCSVLLEAAELKVKQVAGDEIIPFEELSE